MTLLFPIPNRVRPIQGSCLFGETRGKVSIIQNLSLGHIRYVFNFDKIDVQSVVLSTFGVN